MRFRDLRLSSSIYIHQLFLYLQNSFTQLILKLTQHLDKSQYSQTLKSQLVCEFELYFKVRGIHGRGVRG